MERQRSFGLFSIFLPMAATMLLSGWFAPTVTARGVWDTPVAATRRVYLPFMGHQVVATETPQAWRWLDAVNAHRAMAQLPPLVDVPGWSDDAAKHARYVVETDVAGHTEDPGNPWYTPGGAVAARCSNVFASSDMSTSDEFALNAWMVAPFHSVSILDPRLQRTGFGSYRAAGPLYTMAAVLDVIRGRGELPSQTVFPVLWPGLGAVVPLRMFWSESPNPFTSCPGYTAPSGIPIIVQVGPGNRTPHVSAHSFTRDGIALEHCVFDETTYSNPDGTQQNVGRAILGLRDAIVLLPRDPLDWSTSYSVSLTDNNQTYAWTFTVGAAP